VESCFLIFDKRIVSSLVFWYIFLGVSPWNVPASGPGGLSRSFGHEGGSGSGEAPFFAPGPWQHLFL